MLASCPTACASCEDKAAACDRAPNSLAPRIPSAGTIIATFVRLMTSFPQYSPRALSRPGDERFVARNSAQFGAIRRTSAQLF